MRHPLFIKQYLGYADIAGANIGWHHLQKQIFAE
jgi:hypothetical protein